MLDARDESRGLMETQTKEDLAWAAGIIDGEGCFFISKLNPRKKHYSISHRIYFKINMVHKPTIERLYCMFGKKGLFYPVRKRESFHLQQWGWDLWGLALIDMVRKIHPYLITKIAEAEILLQFHALGSWRGGHRTLPKDITIQREALYKKCRELKRYEYHRCNDE